MELITFNERISMKNINEPALEWFHIALLDLHFVYGTFRDNCLRRMCMHSKNSVLKLIESLSENVDLQLCGPLGLYAER